MVMFYVQSLFWLLLALLLGYLLGRWIKGLICRRREQALPPRMEDAGEVSVQRAAVGAADRAGLYTGRAADDTARGTAATGSLSGTDAAIPVVRAERREPPAAAEGLKPGTEAGLAAGAAAGLAGMAAAVHTGRAEAAETAETGTGDVAQRVIPASGSITSGPVDDAEIGITPARVVPASGSITSGPVDDTEVGATPPRVVPASGSITSGPVDDAEAGTVPPRVVPASGSITSGPVDDAEAGEVAQHVIPASGSITSGPDAMKTTTPADSALAATGAAAAASDSDCTRRLLALLQDAGMTAARTGTLTRTLWLESGTCDCGCLPGPQLVLEPGASGTLGELACSVSRFGSAGVGGDFSNLEPGYLVLFQRHGVVACRQGDAYCFVLPDAVDTGTAGVAGTVQTDDEISGGKEAGAVAAAVGVASAALGGISALQSGQSRVVPASGSIGSGPEGDAEAGEVTPRVIPASGSITSGPVDAAEAGTVPQRVIPASGSITSGPMETDEVTPRVVSASGSITSGPVDDVEAGEVAPRVVPASGSISSGPEDEAEVGVVPQRVIPASGSITSGPMETDEVAPRVIPASGSITGGSTVSLLEQARQALNEAHSGGSHTRTLLLARVDCEFAGNEPDLVLTAKHYDRIGSIHCGVPGAGFVAVGGNVASLEDGRAVLFIRHRIVVCRSGDEHRFLRLEPVVSDHS